MSDALHRLSRRDRTGNDVETMFDYLDRLEPEGWQVEVVTGISEIVLSDAYEGAICPEAAEFTRTVTAPTIAAYHVDEELPGVDIDYWEDKLGDVEGENNGVSLKPQSDRITELYDSVREEYREDDFDYIVSPFAGGIAPLYAVEQAFEADPVLLQYSKDRGDTVPKKFEGLDKEATFAGADVLVVDDIVESGLTFEAVGDYLTERGAASIDMVPAWSLTSWEIQESAEPISYGEVVSYRSSE